MILNIPKPSWEKRSSCSSCTDHMVEFEFRHMGGWPGVAAPTSSGCVGPLQSGTYVSSLCLFGPWPPTTCQVDKAVAVIAAIGR